MRRFHRRAIKIRDTSRCYSWLLFNVESTDAKGNWEGLFCNALIKLAGAQRNFLPKWVKAEIPIDRNASTLIWRKLSPSYPFFLVVERALFLQRTDDPWPHQFFDPVCSSTRPWRGVKLLNSYFVKFALTIRANRDRNATKFLQDVNALESTLIVKQNRE